MLTKTLFLVASRGPLVSVSLYPSLQCWPGLAWSDPLLCQGRKRGEELRTRREAREAREGRFLSHLKSSPADRYREKDPEPACFPVFRWSLILLGLGMLVCVLVVLVQLLVDWGRGTA